MRSPINAIAAAALCLFASGTVKADTLRGTVVDPTNTPIAGASVFLSGRTTPILTNSLGVFVVSIPTGSYDIEIDPGVPKLVPVRFLGVQVVVLKDMGTIVLKAGFDVSGKVVDSGNSPVPSVDINVYDQITGAAIFVTNDNTDLQGDFSVVVEPGIYRFEFRPVPTALLVATEVLNIAVSADKNIGTVTLLPGVVLSGTVVDSVTNAPIASVDIDVEDRFGRRVITPNDRTQANGTFAVVVPIGLLHIMFEPPSSTNYAGLELFNRDITGPTNLGTVGLVTGIRLSGRVLGPGATPVVDADIDVDTAVGERRIFTPHDNTDAAGNFSVIVPAGVYVLTIEPQKSNLLVATRTASITVSAATTLPAITLVPGVLLSGTVIGHDNNPEIDADIDVVNPTTGVELVTPGDDTDALGRYSVVVPTGTWDVRFLPGKVSFSRNETVTGVSVAGPTTLDRKLTLVPIAAYFDTQGVPTISNGGSVISLLAFMNPTLVAQQTAARIVFIDPTRQETTILGPLFLNVPSSFAFVSIFMVPTPPINPALLGLRSRLEVRFDDPVTGLEQDHSRFEFFIK